MRSMTGQGTGSARSGDFQLRVDIRSVNHRFLDTVFRLPSELAEQETALRNRIAQAIERGRVSVSVEIERNGGGVELQIDEDFVAAYVKSARALAKKHGLGDALELDRILAMPEAMRVRARSLPDQELGTLLDDAFAKALDSFQSMRAKEGAALAKALGARLKTIERERKQVAKLAAEVPKELQKKLHQRLAKLGAADAVDPSRFAAEVALLVDRATISEELERLHSHVQQFGEALQSEQPVAKRLGFLLQEMHREVNTTGSKSTHLGITQSVLRMKEEIESLREQIANLE